MVAYQSKDYPDKLRRVKYHDDNTLVFLTNNFTLPAMTIAELYRCQLASRDVLQMDQAKPANQDLLWHLRKCSQSPNLDCRISLCARCHYEEATQIRGQSLHNSTGLECNYFRVNALIASTYRFKLQNRI